MAAAGWAGVVRPALDLRAASLTRISQVETVSAALDRLPATFAAAPAAELPPLRTRVTDAARSAGLDIRRLDPQGAAISVTLDDVPFAALVGWLDRLTTTARVRVLSAEIGRRPTPGVVTARLVLEEAR